MLHPTQNDYRVQLYQAIGTGNKVTALYLINNSGTMNFFLNGSTPLHWAIYKNADLDIIKLLLDKGANIYVTCHRNYTPLQIAIGFHRITAAAILIQRGALVGENLSLLLVKPAVQSNLHLMNMIIDYGMQYEPSISLQCRLRVINSKRGLEIIDECIPEKLETKLSNNADANSTHNQLLTPLHVACEDENRNKLRAFLENRVDHFVVNSEGQTPDLVNKLKTREKIQLLLKNNGNIEAVNGIGRTPLLEACHHGNNEAVKVLLENHANPHAMDCFGRTALHFSCERKHKTTSSIIQLLLEHNANIEAVNWVGRTPLFVACLNGNDGAVKVLLENHANPNATNQRGQTALHFMCLWKPETTLQIIQLLLKHNADINAVDQNGWTPLFVACRLGNIGAVKCLLENHANPNIMDRKNETALQFICKRNHETTHEMIQLLLKHNADINVVDQNSWTPLLLACISKNIVAFKCLLENHANPNITDWSGRTALHFMCAWDPERTLQIAQLLLKYNADIDAVDRNGCTPLLEACRFGNIVAFKCLLENHANPNVTNRSGRTALHVNCLWETETTLQIIQLLLKYNADIEAVDGEGRTPLFLACIHGNDIAVKGLLRYGANVDISDKRNQSPLQCAVDKMLSTSSVNSNIYTIIKMLVLQIIKLKTARLNVNACEFITINGVKYSAIDELKYYTVLDDTIDTFDIKCKEEIEKMKMESIGIDDMFFYDLLTQHIHILGILMENEKIQEILKPSIYDEKFPLYIGIIRFRLRDAQIRYRRYKLKKSAREYFSSNIKQELSHECIDKVLDYLTVVDLKTFIRTFEPSRGK